MDPFFRLFGPVLAETVDWRKPAFWVATVLLVVSAFALTLAYLARLFTTIFLGELRGLVQTERRLPAILASGGIVTTLGLLGTMAGSLITQLAPMLWLIPG